MSEYQIIVKFGKKIPQQMQGPVMLAMEKALRQQGVAAEVLKETMADELKSRAKMTPLERAKL